MRNRSLPLLACAVMAALTAACSKSGADDPAAPVVTTDAAAPPVEGACRLLQTREVAAVFSGTRSGEVDDSRKQYGISACTWNTSRGTFVAQFWTSEGASAQDEAKSLALGVVDPLKGEGARNNVRFEAITGVGEQAVAVIETKDEQRGVLTDFAMLVAQRGGYILVLIAPSLARAERAKALQDLQSLGKSAVSRL